MEHYNIIVIGGDAAGMSAASQARRIETSLSIAVFDKGEFVSYAACGMPYYISGEVGDYTHLMAIDKDEFIKSKKINIFNVSEATRIDFNKKTVSIKNADTEKQFTYDKLIIATGASPVIPPLKGINSERVFFLRNLSHGIAIKNFIEHNKPKTGIIIGGGFIGLEMSEALIKQGIAVTLVERFPSVAMTMSPIIHERITEELLKNNVMVHTGVSARSITISKNQLHLQLDGNDLCADFIIVSAGILPNTGFLKGSPLQMNNRGAIIVDEKSRTTIPDVYAAGDCATVKHLVTGEDYYMPLGTTANKQGRVAGLQAAGIDSELFKGIVGSQFVKVFDLEVGKTGFNAEDASRAGIESSTQTNLWKSRAGYYPGAESIISTMTINSKTREVIGGECAGTDGAVLRTNTVAAAIASKMKVDDLAYLDLGYAPPFSPVWDPVNAVAQKFIIRNK